MFKRIKNLLFILAITLIMCCSISETYAQSSENKPNIVFILADDFGYGSVNSYGAESNLLRTPHIDRLAEEGMRFTNASTPASICTPARYAFLLFFPIVLSYFCHVLYTSSIDLINLRTSF